MNFLNKKVLLALALIGLGNKAFGYTTIINNKTKKPVIIEIKLTGDIPMNHRYFIVTQPGRPCEFNFGGGKIGLCRSSIRIADWNTAEVEQYSAEYRLTPEHKKMLLDTKTDIYGLNASYDPVKRYFWNYVMFHTPAIFYPKTAFDTEKIVTAMESLGSSAEKAGELVGRGVAAGTTGGASEVAGSMGSLDLGVGKLLGSMTGLIVEGVQKGACGDRTFDLYSVTVKVPNAKQKEDTFVLIHRAN